MLHDSKINLSEINKVVYRDRGYFGAKSKGYDATMKRAVKEHPLGIKNILRNKSISSKRAPWELVYVVTRKVFKTGKILIITVQKINLNILRTAFVIFGIN